MSAPYIPLYIDDFDGATAHLTCEEEGAYMRLIKLAWRTPGCSLPNDDAWIARKIRMTPEQFQAVAKPVLKEFFKLIRGRWVQGRLKKESDKLLARNRERSEAGKRGALAKALKDKKNTSSSASVLPKQPEPEPEPEPEPDIIAGDDGASACSRARSDWPEKDPGLELIRLANSPHLDPNRSTHLITSAAEIGRWKAAGCEWALDVVPVVIAIASRSRNKISNWSYFTEAITQERDRRLSPLPEPDLNHVERPSVNSASRQSPQADARRASTEARRSAWAQAIALRNAAPDHTDAEPRTDRGCEAGGAGNIVILDARTR